jgi:hypothetical protein
LIESFDRQGAAREPVDDAPILVTDLLRGAGDEVLARMPRHPG